MTALQYGWRRREHTAPGRRPDRRRREGADLQRMLLLLLMVMLMLILMLMLMLMLLLLPCRLPLHHMRRLPRLTPAAPSFHLNCSLQRRHDYEPLCCLTGSQRTRSPASIIFIFPALSSAFGLKDQRGDFTDLHPSVSYQPQLLVLSEAGLYEVNPPRTDPSLKSSIPLLVRV